MEMNPGALRNFKDFLQLYNKMTENCFARCIDNINSRTLDQNEKDCVDDCSEKFIKYNNKLMQHFVKAQTDIVNKRVEDAEKQQQLDANKNSTLTNQSQLENETYTITEQRGQLDNRIGQNKTLIHSEGVS